MTKPASVRIGAGWVAGLLAAGALAWAPTGRERAATQEQPEAPKPGEEPQPEAPQPGEAPAGDRKGEGSPEDKKKGAENNAAEGEMSPKLEAAVAKGLRWLASRQNQDGSFGDQRQWGPSVAITSLSGLAFMSDGHLPGRGAYGDAH